MPGASQPGARDARTYVATYVRASYCYAASHVSLTLLCSYAGGRAPRGGDITRYQISTYYASLSIQHIYSYISRQKRAIACHAWLAVPAERLHFDSALQAIILDERASDEDGGREERAGGERP